MQILIIGDSWSVPNYRDPNGDPKETHSEFLLKNLGHTVHNCGMNGGSNFGTLDRAKVYLSGKEIGHPAHLPNQGMIRTDQEKIDLVIWFHTEPYRDIHLISPTNKTIDQQLHEICGIIYREYKDFLDSLNAKIAVIGGCSDIHDTLYEYITPDFCWPSWQKKLLGIGSMGFNLSSGTTPTENDIQLLDNSLKVIQAMMESSYFPDNCHPGKQAHKELVEALLEKFSLIPE
jgi:hypothetical protein